MKITEKQTKFGKLVCLRIYLFIHLFMFFVF